MFPVALNLVAGGPESKLRLDVEIQDQDAVFNVPAPAMPGVRFPRWRWVSRRFRRGWRRRGPRPMRPYRSRSSSGAKRCSSRASFRHSRSFAAQVPVWPPPASALPCPIRETASPRDDTLAAVFPAPLNVVAKPPLVTVP